jgi:hypothetical protein
MSFAALRRPSTWLQSPHPLLDKRAPPSLIAHADGARDGAAATLRLKHVDLVEDRVLQDGREVRTKNAKSIEAWFFPVDTMYRDAFGAWVRYRREERLFGPNGALFPWAQIGWCNAASAASRADRRAAEAGPRARAPGSLRRDHLRLNLARQAEARRRARRAACRRGVVAVVGGEDEGGEIDGMERRAVDEVVGGEGGAGGAFASRSRMSEGDPLSQDTLALPSVPRLL